MPLQTRAIKRRIKSVTNTRKITKAMELVAASKMRKSVSAVLQARPYTTCAWETVLSIGKRVDTSLHPLLRIHETMKRVLVIVISSDRGLAGGYNTNIMKAVLQEMHSFGKEMEISTICLGKRGAEGVKRAGYPILASFMGLTNGTKFEEVLPIGRMVIDEFVKGAYDRVLIAFTDFVSPISQKPVIRQLLPLRDQNHVSDAKMAEYTFEPSPLFVLNKILPRLVETILYHTVLESAAAEHSARMMAMRSASDNAKDMIGDLTFTFNQARQAGITQEIAEISSGKAALE